MTTAAIRVRQLDAALWVIKQRSATGLTVNLYLLIDAWGLVLIDSGFPDRLGDLRRAFAQIDQTKPTTDRRPIRLEDIRAVFYTHTHVDHMGGGPELAAATDAEHVMWVECGAIAADWWRHQERNQNWRPLFERVLADEPEMLALYTRPYQQTTRVTGTGAIEPVRLMGPADRLDLGPWRFRLVKTAGHDPHHAAVLEERSNIAFTGDTVLAVPTPLVRSMGDDTRQYLDSLDRLTSLDLPVAYPGHGPPFRRLSKRIEHSRRQVLERHETILRVLADGPMSLSQLSKIVGGPLAQRPDVFALVLANVDSAVHYLSEEGLVRLGQFTVRRI